jgi:hypothetical protein
MEMKARCMLGLRRPGLAVIRTAGTVGDPREDRGGSGQGLPYEPLHGDAYARKLGRWRSEIA